MAYQALARKWRPQRFEDVIGQRGVVETLRNAIAGGRLAQSFIDDGQNPGARAQLRERADRRSVRRV